MIVRDCTDADLARLYDLHSRSGLDYQLPAVPREEFFSLRVVEGDGDIGMAAFLRRTAEAYLLCNPEWRTPAWRLEAIRQISSVCNDDAKKQGVVDVVAFLPPEVASRFGKRLEQLDWSKSRDGWISYSHKVR